jgi:transposase-like protein
MIQNKDKTTMMFDLVNQWQQSGLSQQQFSDDHDIKLPTFSYWVKKYREQKTTETGFAKVDLSSRTDSLTAARIEIELADGTIVRIF